MLFVTLAVMMITWGKGFTEKNVNKQINFVSGRADCQSIKISAESDPGCTTLTIKNRGMLNIKKVLVRSPDGTINQEVEDVLVGQDTNVDLGAYSKLTLLPVVEVNKELIGCNDKKLSVECP
ncbi:hypothetical protein D6777_04185 [Candidatus Woesearchaeota archaeon]|nr:MAG: hypothetical protein D6777_04185 [Candidatus Woesearchaeota archaeon]